MTLEERLLAIAATGQHVAIGTTPQGGWSASIGTWMKRDYGKGATPSEALENADANMAR